MLDYLVLSWVDYCVLDTQEVRPNAPPGLRRACGTEGQGVRPTQLTNLEEKVKCVGLTLFCSSLLLVICRSGKKQKGLHSSNLVL
jgi:hypothetical protein